MDWVTLLLVFIFFVLPIIQQVLEQAQKAKRLPPPEEEGRELGTAEGLPRPTRREAPPVATLPTTPRTRNDQSRQERWSEGWGAWPGEPSAEPESDYDTQAREHPTAPEGVPEVVVPEERRIPEVRVAEERALPEVIVPEDLHGRDPVILWEPPAEARVERRPRPELIRQREFPVTTFETPALPADRDPLRTLAHSHQGPRADDRREAISSRRYSRPQLVRGLSNPAEVRRAIVLAEVLGTPVGVRRSHLEREDTASGG